VEGLNHIWLIGIQQILDPQTLVFSLIGASILLILVVVIRPSITVSREGKILVFLAFFILPIIAAGIGASEHMASAEQTQFCLSCHIMEPYGRSLYVDDPSYIPAAHFQNHRIPPDQACYTCHTDYAMFGTARAKLEGLHHVYVDWFGTPMNPIRLYHPFKNQVCLHCHAGARSFESPAHMAMMDDLKSNTISCTTSGCHDTFHNVDKLNQLKFWKPLE
jgi:nitrate/TMAO reductase-like tetraheme cytochrome c subunit